MSALRHRLGAVGFMFAALAATSAIGQSAPGNYGNMLNMPPALRPPLAGERPFLPPLRGRGRGGSIGDLIGMMDAMGTQKDLAIIDEPVTSFGNENFWLSDMELSARAVVEPAAPVAGERLAARR